MAKLTAATRNELPSSAFVFPATRKFPINNPSHARNALARGAQKGGAVAATVGAKVAKKYPSIGQSSRKWATGKRPATVKSDRGTFGMK